ncbi:hypothetical protein GH865_11780 [Rhodocyclus tenuis]|uniref:hypothetical protein n=1 Tax=Rhodocyclus gracilis TaxID=2929842 RepID=UPI001298D50E|nr:hypothetical protein [Rhodocyclus gracilis]MRD73920.1 hypothetical protein [Rhodocyclus gracilis]
MNAAHEAALIAAAQKLARARYTVEENPLTDELRAEASKVLARFVTARLLEAGASLKGVAEDAPKPGMYRDDATRWALDALYDATMPDGSRCQPCLVSHMTNRVFSAVAHSEPSEGFGASVALRRAMVAHGLVAPYALPFGEGDETEEEDLAALGAATGYGLAKVAGIDLYTFIKDCYAKTAAASE